MQSCITAQKGAIMVGIDAPARLKDLIVKENTPV